MLSITPILFMIHFINTNIHDFLGQLCINSCLPSTRTITYDSVESSSCHRARTKIRIALVLRMLHSFCGSLTLLYFNHAHHSHNFVFGLRDFIIRIFLILMVKHLLMKIAYLYLRYFSRSFLHSQQYSNTVIVYTNPNQ